MPHAKLSFCVCRNLFPYMSLVRFYEQTLLYLGDKVDIADTSNPLGDKKLAALAKKHAIALQKAQDARPQLRTSFTGRVPLNQIDWSVRESDLPKPIHNYVRERAHNFVPNHGLTRGPSKDRPYYPFRTAAHGCVLTADWSDEMVRQWTIAAHFLNVHFHGPRRYSLPKREDISTRGTTFQLKKQLGSITHKRSDLSIAKRKLRKFARSYRLASAPLVHLPFPGSKQLRKEFHMSRKTQKLKFQDFKKARQRTVTSVWCCRAPAPDIVISAIEKIYRNCVYSPVIIAKDAVLDNVCVVPQTKELDFEQTHTAPVYPRKRFGKITLQERTSPGSDRIMRSTLLNFGVKDKPTIVGRLGSSLAAWSWS